MLRKRRSQAGPIPWTTKTKWSICKGSPINEIKKKNYSKYLVMYSKIKHNEKVIKIGKLKYKQII